MGVHRAARLALLVIVIATPSAAAGQSVVGDWTAAVKVGATTLHWVLHIRQGTDGLVASLDSPDQGVENVLVEPIEFKDRRLVFDVYVVGGTFDGLLSDDGTTIKGGWRQGDDMLPMTFTRALAEERR